MKDKQIVLRISAEEKAELKQKASNFGMPLSKYLLRCASRKKIINSELLLSLIREINRIGCNINQATKIMNTYHNYDDTDFNYIYREFTELKKKVDEFINKENSEKNGNS